MFKSPRKAADMQQPKMAKLIIIFMVALLVGRCLCCHEYQRQALLLFKVSLLGNGSSFLTTWNSSSSDCCRWERVRCNSPQVITSLDLSDLTGLGFDDLVSHSTASLSVATSHVLTPIFHLKTLAYLDISYNGIQGEIPGAGLANLTNLVELHMEANNFNGSIPPQLFSLAYLEWLELDYNLMEGTLDSNIGYGFGNLTNLQVLDLSNNKFSGAVPSSLLGLKILRSLDLGHNSFSMEIPVEIGNLSNIEVLKLEKNNFWGKIPASIQRMEPLISLNLQDNFLSGEIPAWLFDSNLEELYLGGNNLSLNQNMVPSSMSFSVLSLRSCNISGEIPIWISNLTELLFLDLSKNNLKGTFPPWLAQSARGYLILSDNEFSGSLPPRLFQNHQLTVLIISNNNFTGLLPDTIGEAIGSRILMLSSNHFSGPVPKSISTLPQLVLLDLSSNKFSGNEFPIFNQNSSLLYIDISSNNLSGEVPGTFPSSMKLLQLSQNEFSGFLPESLSNFSNLKYLDLHDNYITGEIPQFLCQLQSLQILNLRNNLFNGSIPMNLSNLNYLQILDLSGNNLVGKIPPNLGNLNGMITDYHVSSPPIIGYAGLPSLFILENNDLKDLEVSWKSVRLGLPSLNLQLYTFLDISNNGLSGEIPDSIGGLNGLKSLNVSSNKLSGKIPMSLGYLQSLESLDLSHNYLSGEIPETLAKLLQLSYLDVSNNKLKGPIPSGPQMDRINDLRSYANNSGLCGMQIQVPCEKPSPKPQPTKGEVEESSNWETWFSWKTAVIGYVSGFLSTILVIYITGHFNVTPHLRPWT